MKNFTLVSLLPLLASAAAVPLVPRDGPGHGSMSGMSGTKGHSDEKPGSEIAAFAQGFEKIFKGTLPAMKAMKIEEMEPKVQKDAKRVKMIWGPFKVKAADAKEQVGNMISMDRYGTSYQYMAAADFPRDITLLNTKSEVVDENFKRSDIATGLYNHHDVFFNLNRGAPSVVNCGNKAVPSSGYGLGGAGLSGGALPVSIFIGGATEVGEAYYATSDPTVKSGYYIGPNDKLTFGLDVVNYKNAPRDIYLVAEMEYLQGKQANTGAANSAVISLGMCNGVNPLNIQTANSTAKFTLDSGNDITFMRDGWFTGWKAHLHDGGVNMVSYLNGKQVCDSKALYGGEGHTGVSASGETWTTIREMTGCDTPIKIKKGDKLQVKAYYDTDLHPSREEAHGEMAEQMGLLTGLWVDPPTA